jgi:hypothetical protein
LIPSSTELGVSLSGDKRAIAADRTAVLEILRDTLPDLPDYWKK